MGLKGWRARVFALTWLSYFAYYFCRKPFYINKPVLEAELGWTPDRLGAIGASYLVAYAIGQFTSAFFGDRVGARALVVSGMAVTAVMNVAFGLTSAWLLFAIFMFINGLAQATGWPGNVAAMAQWFRREERGTVMGLWATNFQAGGVAANALAAYLLGAYGFRWAFFAGALVVLGVALLYLGNVRNRPEDVGLKLDDAREEGDDASDGVVAWSRAVWTNVLLVGGFYFFIKFIRYALWSWAPYLLKKYYGLLPADAGYLSTAFDVAGIVGVVLIGVVSDRLFAGRRAGVSFAFVLAMTGACALLYVLGSQSLLWFGASIALIGFFLYGPDALMSGAGAIEVGSKRSAAKAAGLINGMGAIGAVVQELALGRLLKDAGVGPVFATLVASSLCAAACLAVILRRNKTGAANL